MSMPRWSWRWEATAPTRKALSDLAEAARCWSQPDMAELAQGRRKRLEAEKQRQEYELRLLLLPRDPDADKTWSWRSARARAATRRRCSARCCMRMYTRYAERHRFSCGAGQLLT